MNKKDAALTISNPRILTAVYFSLLAIIATIATDTVLYAIGIRQLLPISKEILLGVIVAALFGALFGERIVHSKKPFRTHVFLWAFLMVMVSLPVYDIGFIYLMREAGEPRFIHASLPEMIHLYLFVLGYSFILVGVWLAFTAGLAAIYLRGYLEYYLLQSIDQRPNSSRNPIDKIIVTTGTRSKQPK